MSPSELKEKSRSTLRIITGILAAIMAIAIFILSSIPGNDYPTHPAFLNTVVHFFLYAALGICLTLALNSPRRALWLTALFAILITSAYGASDEIHQIFTPHRSPDVLDWLTDTAGALVGAIGTIWVLSARKVKRSRSRDSMLK